MAAHSDVLTMNAQSTTVSINKRFFKKTLSIARLEITTHWQRKVVKITVHSLRESHNVCPLSVESTLDVSNLS